LFVEFKQVTELLPKEQVSCGQTAFNAGFFDRVIPQYGEDWGNGKAVQAGLIPSMLEIIGV